MAKTDSALQTISTMVAFSPAMAGMRAKLTFAFAAMLFLSFTCLAQDAPPQDAPPNAATPAPSAPAAFVTIPAGTRLALVLTSPVASKTVHRGDTIYAQSTAPVAVGNSVAIPAWTFVQGKVKKLVRNGTRAEMSLDSVSVIFPDGYVANVAGPLNLETDEGTAWKVASKGGMIGAIAAPAIGGAAGALIGHAANSSSGMTLNGLTINPDRLQSTAIGTMAGLGAGGILGMVFLFHSRQFYVDVGSPMELTLPQPLTLAQAQVDDAIRNSQSQPPPIPPVARHPSPPDPWPTFTHTCYTPDTPGTPPTVIPGTPPMGDAPGTPDIVIPGPPAIPGTPYPCN
jgi:hypothetical protein